ncbi:sarcosine oxidase subunit gamma [Oryzibacter oryziterrae]|uniref:sarcosine oxidase subunit gamma n=1 Tax=Oryzibacter oryziterrae TaxID=2766474 RepID=UPI001F2B5538|nr:sarcosine oxidase subunit gamma [Oryzibacter oryziterrae]
MVDISSDRRTVLDGLQFTSPADAEVRIEPVAAMSRLALRGRPGIETAVAPVFGFNLPSTACTSATAAEYAALWVGPDEWLVTAPDGRVDVVKAALEEACAGVPHAITDISHRNVGLTISGPKATWVLSHGCPLDFDLAAFPVGMCTRTLLGRTEVVLWRRAEDTFRIEVWRTFADYLIGFLNEARKELAA